LAYLNRIHAEKLMSDAGLDALILLSPESFYYVTGAPPGVATMWRTAGAVATLIPADASETETAIVSDLFADIFRRSSHITDIRESPIWVETATLESIGSDVSASELIHNAWDSSGRKADFNRPATFDPAICYQHLSEALEQRGLARGRIGFESTALTMNDHKQ